MTDNVIPWRGITRLDIDPARVIDYAAKAGLESVIIIGVTADGEQYFASSLAHGGETLWQIERAKITLLSTDD